MDTNQSTQNRQNQNRYQNGTNQSTSQNRINTNNQKDQQRDQQREFFKNIAKLNGHLMHSNDRPHLPKSVLIKFDSSKIPTCFVIKGTLIEFLSLKSDKAAYHCISTGSKKVVIMNFANRFTHGGGYLNGARAQEEDLCRVIPALYSSLKNIQYPYDKDSVIITPNLTIMRDSDTNYEFLPIRNQISVGIVSVAAQNLQHEQFDEQCVRRTLANMYCSVKCHLSGTDTLILGAWGCGAFRNDPNIMARIMNEVNLMYGGYFGRIVFSVPVGMNHDEFKNTILQTV